MGRPSSGLTKVAGSVITFYRIQSPVDELFYVSGFHVGTIAVVVTGFEDSEVAIMSVATPDLQIESRATIQFINARGRRKAEISRCLFPTGAEHSPLPCATH